MMELKSLADLPGGAEPKPLKLSDKAKAERERIKWWLKGWERKYAKGTIGDPMPKIYFRCFEAKARSERWRHFIAEEYLEGKHQ